MSVLWICNRNLPTELASFLTTCGGMFAPYVAYESKCSGAPRSLEIDRNTPEKDWPSCDVCGEKMIPYLEEVKG